MIERKYPEAGFCLRHAAKTLVRAEPASDAEIFRAKTRRCQKLAQRPNPADFQQVPLVPNGDANQNTSSCLYAFVRSTLLGVLCVLCAKQKEQVGSRRARRDFSRKDATTPEACAATHPDDFQQVPLVPNGDVNQSNIALTRPAGRSSGLRFQIRAGPRHCR